MYILFLVPVYAAGLANWFVFIIQALFGISTAFLIFVLATRVGSAKPLAFITSASWLLYAPAALYESSLLPVSVLSLLICVWSLLEIEKPSRFLKLLSLGLVAGMIAGLRPPFILLGVFSILVRLYGKRLIPAVIVACGFGLPLLVISFYHLHEDGVFSPFASSLGVNLIQGHADGATGYGPPIPEYGLIESPSENIHEVGQRIAAEQGFTAESEANRFWLEKALTWIRSNPGKEIRLLGIKLGAFLGYRPFDSYFDLTRDVESDASLRHLIVPRFLLVLLTCFGTVSWLVFSRKHVHLVLPLLTVLITTLAFFACERYWIPALPVSLSLAAYGIAMFSKKYRSRTGTALLTALAVVLLMLPGAIWPVPEIPSGQYYFNRGVKAFNTGNNVLALSLFEESAANCPTGTTMEVHARIQAFNLAVHLGMRERAMVHEARLEELGVQF